MLPLSYTSYLSDDEYNDAVIDSDSVVYASKNGALVRTPFDTMLNEELLKLSSPVAWQEKCTDYLRSLFSPVAIFVLMTVAATMGYGKRKNVLLFSIIQCLCIAVVYYVSDMVFSIASHQGTFHPSLSVILPPIVTIAINFIIDRIGRLL